MNGGAKESCQWSANRKVITATSADVPKHAMRGFDRKSRKTSANDSSLRTMTIARRSMLGNNRKGIILQERDRHVLRELGVMRVIDREQAKIVAGFGSTTRANTRLLALVRAGFLRRYFLGMVGGAHKSLY